MTMPSFGRPAPIARRALAYVIDVLIGSAIPVLGVVVAVVLAFGPLRGAGLAEVTLLLLGVVLPATAVVSLAWALVYTFMQSRGGSIGMRAQGIRLASAADGRPLGFWAALLRNVIFGMAASIVVGYFTPLFDGSGRFQGWHDKVSGALMLDALGETPAAPAGAADLSSAPPPSGPPVVAAPPSGAFPPPTGAPVSGAPAPGAQAPGAAAPVAPAPAHTSAFTPPAASIELPEETVIAPRAGGRAAEDPLISFVPGVTQPPAAPAAAAATPAPAPPAPASTFHPEPAPQPAPAPQPTPAASADADDEDIESTRISIPGHRLVFTWDDGQRATVSGRTLFGRNPEQEPGAVAVAVRDETLSLSKTHFEASAQPGSGGWVMDRHSTNGTVVVREGMRIACPPGQRVPIRLGDALEIGDRIVTIGGYA